MKEMLIGIVLAIFLLLSISCYQQYSKINKLIGEKAINEFNIKALSDTVRTERNKIGELQYSKDALVSDKNDLAELNKQLAEEVKNQKGRVLFLTSSNANLKFDTPRIIIHQLDKLSDSEYIITSSIENIYDSSNHKAVEITTRIKLDSNKGISVLESKMVKDDFGFNIITGLKEEDKNLRIFIRSDYPGLSFSKIDGALIDPRSSKLLKSFFPDKKWGLGVQWGLGVSISHVISPSVYIGVGISYNLWSW